MSRGFRLLVLVGLLAANGFLMADYAAKADANRPHPPIGDVAADPQAHVGEDVYSWVQVHGITDDGFTVRVDDKELTVISDRPVDPGDHAQVFGTVEADRTIAAEQVVVSPRLNRLYMVGVSFVAVALTLVAFLRSWTVDTRRLLVLPHGNRGRDG